MSATARTRAPTWIEGGLIVASTTCISPTATGRSCAVSALPCRRAARRHCRAERIRQDVCLRLLFRFYDLQKGTVRIDGQNLTEVAGAFARGDRDGAAGYGDVQRHHRLRSVMSVMARRRRISKATVAAIDGFIAKLEAATTPWSVSAARFGRREAACRHCPRHPEAAVDLPVRRGDDRPFRQHHQGGGLAQRIGRGRTPRYQCSTGCLDDHQCRRKAGAVQYTRGRARAPFRTAGLNGLYRQMWPPVERCTEIDPDISGYRQIRDAEDAATWCRVTNRPAEPQWARAFR